jgi:hypothetical protein
MDASYTTIGAVLGKLEGKDPYSIYYKTTKLPTYTQKFHKQ